MLPTRYSHENSGSLDKTRSRLRTVDRSKSDFVGISIFLTVTLFYAMTLAGTYIASPLIVKAGFAALNGLGIGLMFIAGHDACHGSLTASKKINAVIGRICLLPSLHPYTAWAHSHNGLHHSWTNLKGRDPVYAPLTAEEYSQLSSRMRFLERVERSVLGVGLLYMHKVWWCQEVAPSSTERAVLRRKGPYARDLGLVVIYLAVHLTLVWLLLIAASEGLGRFFEAALWGIVVPFLIWNWLMGFLTYQHHTHPEIPWFDRIEEWSRVRNQEMCTAHVRFPEIIDWCLLRIMNHTAHHVDPAIPLYRLRSSQLGILSSARTIRWTLRGCLAMFGKCKLYDFEKHEWLNFAGKSTGLATIGATEPRSTPEA
jgi:omega-6 fatty acid desaturase (delta-12 desaturase)